MKSGGGISSSCGSKLGIAKVDEEFGRVSNELSLYARVRKVCCVVH